MKVPFVDLGAQHRPLEPELRGVFDRILERSSFILGPEVKQFEEAFATYLGSSFCVAVNSGTSALHVALLALGIGPGHEVITVANSFIATAEAISAVGARPVFVDVSPDSYTMDPALVEGAMTERTRAILPVHLYGQPANLDLLLAVARRHNVALVEDACQAHGAEYKGRKAGTLGIAGCFSFYPSKNLGCCGEGGAVVTDNPEFAERVRMLRDHGTLRKYEHQFPGYNFRLEALQAAILSVKLGHLDGWNEQRRRLAQRYNELLADSAVIAPAELAGARHVYHLYVVQVDGRDGLRARLTEQGIETGLHYPLPLHLQPAYRDLGYHEGNLPVSEKLSKRILSLPMYPGLSLEAAEFVVKTLLEAVECQTEAGQSASR